MLLPASPDPHSFGLENTMRIRYLADLNYFIAIERSHLVMTKAWSYQMPVVLLGSASARTCSSAFACGDAFL